MLNKTVVFIDSANFDCALNKIKEDRGIPWESKTDYKKLISLLTFGHHVIEKNVYIGTKKNSNSHQKFFHFFKNIGFRIVTKEVKLIRLDDGKTKYKANFDVEITFDACWHMSKGTCDEIILISGDSDFSYLLDKAKALNLPIKIISSNATISSELRNSANNLILLDDIDISQYLYQKKK